MEDGLGCDVSGQAQWAEMEWAETSAATYAGRMFTASLTQWVGFDVAWMGLISQT